MNTPQPSTDSKNFQRQALEAAIRIGLGSAGYATQWIDAAIALMNAWILVRMVTLVIQSRFWSRVACSSSSPSRSESSVRLGSPVRRSRKAIWRSSRSRPPASLLRGKRRLPGFRIDRFGARPVGGRRQERSRCRRPRPEA